MVMQDFHDNVLPLPCRHRLFLTCGNRDDPTFLRSATSNTFSKTYPKTGKFNIAEFSIFKVINVACMIKVSSQSRKFEVNVFS